MITDYMDELTHDPTLDVSQQSIVGVAGTAIIGAKVKDGGAAGDWASGQILKPYLRCVAAAVGATGGIQVDIVTDTAPGLATAPTVLSTKTIPTASLTANSLHSLPQLAPGTRKRYLGVKITPLATATTAGSVIVGFEPLDGTPQDRVNAL